MNAELAGERRQLAVVLLALLLALDALLIAADVLRHGGVLSDPRFAITRERSFGEMIQYAKFAILVVVLLTAPRRSGGSVAWAVLFVALLVDDSLAVHERLGLRLADRLGLPAVGPLLPRDLGELVVFAGAAVVWLVPLATVLWRGDQASRALTIALLPPLALLAVFGAGGDLVHSLARGQSFRYVAGLVEDGGELVAVSVLVAVAYFETRRQDAYRTA